jgi:phenylpropionate dioxygenase-like ring-hydroxylating dioxygenase large terminal subunit
MPGVSGTAAHTPRVPNYTAIEHDGLVWVNLDSHADPSRIPTLVTNAKPQQRRFLWQTLWQAPIVDCLENFLDAMHTHYVHAGLVRHTAQRRAVSAVLNVTNDGFSIDYRGQSLQSGLLYRLFESPRLSERAIFSAPAVAQIEYRYKNGSVIQITLYFTPHDTHSTHVFATLHLSGRWAPSWLVRMLVWPFLRKVAQQDGHMLQLQTTNRRRFTPQRFVSSPSDLVRPYLERIWSDSIDGPSLPETRTVELLI